MTRFIKIESNDKTAYAETFKKALIHLGVIKDTSDSEYMRYWKQMDRNGFVFIDGAVLTWEYFVNNN